MSRKLFIHCILVFAGIIAGVFASMPRWQIWLQQHRRMEDEVARMHDAERDSAQLIREQARASSRLGREELARSRGWMGADESPAP